jgi:hypothetical protein
LAAADEVATLGGDARGVQGDGQQTAGRSPGNVYITGHRVGGLGPYHTAFEYDDGVSSPATLSAGSTGGKLTSGVNRPSDIADKNIYLGTVTPPNGIASSEYFSRLLAADAQYCDCFDYDVFPEALPGTGYNSNSYVSGLIGATDGIPSVNMNSYYGGSTPLPPGAFRRIRP